MKRNPESSDWMVRLDRVGVTYPNGTRALNPVTIALRPGQFTVLLGLSGAGKSTLLHTINLLVRPTTGQVISDTLGKIDSPAAIRAHRRRTAMIFQQHQLLLRKTALTNVLTGRLGVHPAWRTVLPLPREDVLLAQECLERVGLGDKAFVRADNLSGGQMQRVGIARALAQRPRMILADEPVASLDPTTAVQVLDQLDRIGREDGIATVVSLHQLELARRFAQRIIGLAGGDVIFDGPPAELDRKTLDRIYGTATVSGEIPEEKQAAADYRDDIEEPERAAI